MAPAQYKSVTGSISAPDKHVYKYSEQVVFLDGNCRWIRKYLKNMLYTPLKNNINRNKITQSYIKRCEERYTEAKLVNN